MRCWVIYKRLQYPLSFKGSMSQAIYNSPIIACINYGWNDLSKDFVIGLTLFIDLKDNNYDIILIIINRTTKIVHYKSVKIIIDVTNLREVIINGLVRHHGLLESIINNRGSLFILKFWSLLWYFLNIKQKLSTAFYP